MADGFDQFWECPKCGMQTASGPPVKMHPPKCSWWHGPTEMEQIAAPRFGEAA